MSNDATMIKERRSDPIKELLRPIRGGLILAVTMAVIGQVLALAPLAGIAYIAKIAVGRTETHAMIFSVPGEIWHICVVSLICLGLGLALVAASEIFAHLVDDRLTRHLRLALVRRLAQVPLGWFSDRTSGEIKQSMQDDIGTLHELIAHSYTTRGRCTGAIVASGAYLFYVDWRMALVSLLPFPFFYILFGAAKKSISKERMREFSDGQIMINNAVVEFVSGIPVVKAFGASGKAYDGYTKAVDGFLRSFLSFTRPLVAPLANANALIAPVTVLGIALTFGTLFVELGWITPVDILPFVFVAPGISAPLMLLGFQAHSVTNATGAAERVQALLETPLLEQPSLELKELPASEEVCFENVGYSYDGQNEILSNVSFTLKPGTVTAIVGPSGAGKSTLARLLLRFFDPTEGRITLGGVDLRRIQSQDLYHHVGFVLQEVQLINASLHENIALGRPSASREEIEAAARAANIHDHILALPSGYDSVIGEDTRLSGGEAQRVSIARAILLDPLLLVLDEATAATDSESDAAIQNALSSFVRMRTLMVITHRLDSVTHADRIIVIDEGSICEEGTHTALLAQNGRYAQLWRSGGYDQNLPEVSITPQNSAKAVKP